MKSLTIRWEGCRWMLLALILAGSATNATPVHAIVLIDQFDFTGTSPGGDDAFNNVTANKGESEFDTSTSIPYNIAGNNALSTGTLDYNRRLYGSVPGPVNVGTIQSTVYVDDSLGILSGSVGARAGARAGVVWDANGSGSGFPLAYTDWTTGADITGTTGISGVNNSGLGLGNQSSPASQEQSSPAGAINLARDGNGIWLSGLSGTFAGQLSIGVFNSATDYAYFTTSVSTLNPLHNVFLPFANFDPAAATDGFFTKGGAGSLTLLEVFQNVNAIILDFQNTAGATGGGSFNLNSIYAHVPEQNSLVIWCIMAVTVMAIGYRCRGAQVTSTPVAV